MALGQEALTRSGRPRSQNSGSRHAQPPFAIRVAKFVPVLDSSDVERLFMILGEPCGVLTEPEFVQSSRCPLEKLEQWLAAEWNQHEPERIANLQETTGEWPLVL